LFVELWVKSVSMMHSQIQRALALITVLISASSLASHAFSPAGRQPRSFGTGRVLVDYRPSPDVRFVHVPQSSRLHALGASNERESIETLKKATVSLAVALALAGGPLSVAITPDVAFAAPTATSASTVIPEQQAIADAQVSADAASKRLDATRKELSAVQSAFKSAEASYNKANKEATRAKAAFLSANDALSAAKSGKSKDASRIASLTTKVGTYKCCVVLGICSLLRTAQSLIILLSPSERQIGTPGGHQCATSGQQSLPSGLYEP
jgi:hypothetical protein